MHGAILSNPGDGHLDLRFRQYQSDRKADCALSTTKMRRSNLVSSLQPTFSTTRGIIRITALCRYRHKTHWTGPDNPKAGCAIWSQALTAYYPVVELSRVGPGSSVLVTAGSGTAGNGAIQMAKLLGARVIATSRTLDKRDFLLDIGADVVIATDREQLDAQVREETGGHCVDLVYDTVADPRWNAIMDAWRPGRPSTSSARSARI